MLEDTEEVLKGLLHAITIPLKEEKEVLVKEITTLAKTLGCYTEAKANPHTGRELANSLYTLIETCKRTIDKKRARLEDIDAFLQSLN